MLEPSLLTQVAELEIASTSHMIAALNPLNQHLALWTLPKVQTFFQFSDSVLVTLSLVVHHIAFQAVSIVTFFALC